MRTKGAISISILLLFSLLLSALIPIPSPAKAAGTGTNTSPVISPPIGTFEYPGGALDVTVTWGAASPADVYTVYMYSSQTDSCLGPFTSSEYAAPPQTLISGAVAKAVFAVSPTPTNMYLCAQVVDTSGVGVNGPEGLWSGPASYVVASPLGSYINNDESAVSIDSGQSIVLTDFVWNGDPPYTYTWYTGKTCSILGTVLQGPSAEPTYNLTSASYDLGVNYYSVFVVDSSIQHFSDCEYVTVNVSPPLLGSFTIDGATGTISTDVGSPDFQAYVTYSGGTGPWYGVTIYSGSDSHCSGDTTVVASYADISGTGAILTFPGPTTAGSATYYCALVTDGSVGTGAAVYFGPIQVNASPPLTGPTGSGQDPQTGSSSQPHVRPFLWGRFIFPV